MSISGVCYQMYFISCLQSNIQQKNGMYNPFHGAQVYSKKPHDQ